MKMNKAYKFRIYPNKEQKVLMAKTFGCVRFIYNKMLGDKIEHYNRTKDSGEAGEMLKVTPARYKADFEFLKEVDSLALANAQMNLDKAYSEFFKEKSHKYSEKTKERAKILGKPLTLYDLEKHPKFKSKKSNHNSYTTNLVNGNIELVNGSNGSERIAGNELPLRTAEYLKLPKLGMVKVKQHRIIPEGYTLKSVTVSRTPSDKYYASVLYEYEQSIEPVRIENVVGLDFSMTELYIDSNGNEANYPRYYRRMLDKLKRMSRTLSKMQKFSNNWYKQKHKIAVLHERIANQRKDFLHKQSRQIANAYDLVGVEDLNMKAMSQALNFGKSVSDNSWGMFTSFLDYKLTDMGKRLVKIDKWFPSSKLCSVCGYKNDEITLSMREWICPNCGVIHNRDINAAVNIRNEAIANITDGRLVTA